MSHRHEIEETVIKIFRAADKRDWELVKASFSENVLLDYTSMNGGEPVQIAADAIITSWKQFLPGFKATHHQLGNFIIEVQNDSASCLCYGTATHYLPNESNQNVWTVVGDYEFELKKRTNWQVTKMKFNFKYMDGNTSLVEMAKKNISAANS
ncbi:MAG TPA: nuclear transport factor 2 family protein [Flavipsychrobacter sp.]|nr:nuclear transport factor 2 family protein [Flavipsychrobacter sp.]